MFSKINFIFIALLYLSSCSFQEEIKINSQIKSENNERDCANSYTTTCLKLDLVSWVDKLNEEDNYSVFPGVSVIRENATARLNTADIVAELAREFPNDPDARLDAFLIKKLSSYLNSHSIQFNLLNRDSVESARKGGGGGGNNGFGGNGGGGGGKGGGGGGGGGYGGMLMAGAMMKGTILALALGSIAAIAGKALMAGLLSLLLSAVIGIKALTSQGKQTTYEIVSKPVYTHSSSHSVSHEDHHAPPSYGHSSYGRSFDMPLPVGLHPDYKPQ